MKQQFTKMPALSSQSFYFSQKATLASMAFCFLFVLSITNLWAQTAPAKEWDKTFGGTNLDNLTYMQQTADGGYILGGTSNSNAGGDKSENSKGYSDYWVVKLNAAGTKEWDKTFGGADYETLQSLQQTADGGYILGGYSDSGINGDKSQNSRGGVDYWVVKLNAAGNKEWDKTFGGAGYENLQSLQQTADGGFILGGTSNSNISGEKSQNSKGYSDYWVVKLNAAGTKEWDKTFGGADYENLQSLQQTADGGYILGGRSYSPIGGDKSQNSKGGTDYWVVKLNASGNKEWDKTIGGTGEDIINSLDQTADGGYILGGNSGSNISGDKSQNSKGGFYDYWVVKLNAAGTKEWDKTIGGAGNDNLSSLQQTADGGYTLGGYSDSNISGDKSENAKGFSDYWVVKLNAAGTKEWDKTIGGAGYDELYSLQQTADRGYILGGRSESNISGDKSENSKGGFDYWVVKLSSAENCTEPVVSFTTAPVGGSTRIAFTDASSNLAANAIYAWDVDNNGTVDYTVIGSFTHIYPTPGNYTAKLTITQGECSASYTQTVTSPPPKEFIYQTISWNVIDNDNNSQNGRTVDFKISQAWRLSDFNNPTIGSTVATNTLFFGDYYSSPGSGVQYLSSDVALTVTRINTEEGWFYGEATIRHNYLSVIANYYVLNFTAFTGNCCQPSPVTVGPPERFNLSFYFGFHGYIDVEGLNSRNSPVISTMPPVIQLKTGNANASFTVPASDPDGDALSYRLATSKEMGGRTNPSGLSVDATTGVVTWSTVGVPAGTQVYAGIAITDAKGAKIVVEFSIKVNDEVVSPFAFLEFKTKTVSSSEVELLWKAVNEGKTASYELEKSTDGVNFTRIATLPRIIHDGNHTYQFNDKQVSGPSYYRVKQIGTDGSFVYSKTINEKGETTSPSPTPPAAFAFLEFKTKTVSSTEVELLWKAVNEEQTASYELEKSTDGVNFTKIATLPRIIHDGNHTYQFNDKSVSGPSYYRVKQIATDGSVVYSKTINEKGETTSPSPTPPAAFAFLEFKTKTVSSTEVELLWKAVNEEKTASYELEKSADGVSFTRIATLPRIIHDGNHTYQFNDKQVSGPSYYRVKQVATDGSMVYSNVINYNNQMMAAARKPNSSEESIGAAKELAVYPNPAGERAHVTFTLPQAGTYSLSLYDIKGALVKTIATGKAPANQPLAHELEVGAYAKGIYLLKLVSDKQVMTKRMVIEH